MRTLSEYLNRKAEEFYSVSDPRFPFHSDNHILTSKTLKQRIKLPGIRGRPDFKTLNTAEKILISAE